MSTDEELVDRFRRGDPRAFDEVYARYRAPLFGYLRALLGDAAAAEDAYQEVFLSLLRYVREVGLIGSLRGFLYSAARNRALNALRRRTLERNVRGFLTQAGPASPGAAAQEAEDWLEGLPPEQREVVFLKFWGGLTFQEIAAMTAAPANTVMSRYRYALEKLRKREE